MSFCANCVANQKFDSLKNSLGLASIVDNFCLSIRNYIHLFLLNIYLYSG